MLQATAAISEQLVIDCEDNMEFHEEVDSLTAKEGGLTLRRAQGEGRRADVGRLRADPSTGSGRGAEGGATDESGSQANGEAIVHRVIANRCTESAIRNS